VTVVIKESHAATISADKSDERYSQRDLSPLQLLLVKAIVMTFSGLLFVYGSMALIASAIDEKIKPLTGGPAFWRSAEDKLHQLAVAPDLPPEKKERIIQSLRAISAKYRPYIDALKE
jgi:hypothetical protein